jgi:rod shape-determining protein MreD
MIVTPKIAARIAAIVVVGVVLQLSFFSKLTLLGTSPDILPLLVVTLGLLGGSMAGAVCGFSVGLLVDCLLVEALGATSLVLLTTGYLAGLYRERFDVANSLVPPLLCGGLTLFSGIAFAAVQLMLGVDAQLSGLIIREILIETLFAFFIAIPTYIGIRRLLAPALIIDRELPGAGEPGMIGA